MLVRKDDGTFQAGPADIMCILKLPTGTFHVAFFEEEPILGPKQPISELDAARLKSKMYHAIGSATLADEQIRAKKLRLKIKLPNENVLLDEVIEAEDPEAVWVVPNWTRGEVSLKKALSSRS